MGLGQTALSTLVYQGLVPATVTMVYSPSNPVELSRIALANYSDGESIATLYHRKAGVTGDPGGAADNTDDPGATETIAVYTIPTMTTEVDPDQGSGTAITLQRGDTLWAKAKTATSIALSLYALPQNMAPISTPYGIF